MKDGLNYCHKGSGSKSSRSVEYLQTQGGKTMPDILCLVIKDFKYEGARSQNNWHNTDNT
jgi:hypothetical protein